MPKKRSALEVALFAAGPQASTQSTPTPIWLPKKISKRSKKLKSKTYAEHYQQKHPDKPLKAAFKYARDRTH